MIIWAANELLSILKYNGQAFIDAPFKIAPPQFNQLLIIRTLDCATNIFVPNVNALRTTKNEFIYCRVFPEIIKTWTINHGPALCNINNKKDEDLTSRTNNSVERYNRRIQECFKNSHQNLFSFLDVIHKEIEYFISYICLIKKRKENPPSLNRDFIRQNPIMI
ncbi:hypothetical protein HZS_3420 [Henneguya salminicola]|nr:hypothetical protein HZS_3420 [Henneguya salminicola]